MKARQDVLSWPGAKIDDKVGEGESLDIISVIPELF